MADVAAVYASVASRQLSETQALALRERTEGNPFFLVELARLVGERLRDPEAVARAAISTTEGVLWRSGEPGEVNEEVVAALRGSLERLPAEDSDLRCRTMLALVLDRSSKDLGSRARIGLA